MPVKVVPPKLTLPSAMTTLPVVLLGLLTVMPLPFKVTALPVAALPAVTVVPATVLAVTVSNTGFSAN